MLLGQTLLFPPPGFLGSPEYAGDLAAGQEGKRVAGGSQKRQVFAGHFRRTRLGLDSSRPQAAPYEGQGQRNGRGQDKMPVLEARGSGGRPRRGPTGRCFVYTDGYAAGAGHGRQGQDGEEAFY